MQHKCTTYVDINYIPDFEGMVEYTWPTFDTALN